MWMLLLGLALGFWVIPMVLGIIGAGRSQESTT